MLTTVPYWLTLRLTLSTYSTASTQQHHVSALNVSLKKTEVMLQPHNRSSFVSPSITAGDVKLPMVDEFCYLGCILTSDAIADEDINSRIAKASAAFVRLRNRLWDEHSRLDTKISVYVAVVLTILLYGCETWTLYRRLASSGFGHSGTPSPPFPSVPLPSLPSFSPPLPPSRSPWAPPLSQLGGLGSDVSSSVWVWGKAPADKRFGAYI